MANTRQAKKRARQAVAHHSHNAAQRSQLRNTVKRVRKAIADQDKASAAQAYREATSVIDRMAGKGLLHKNAAARQKNRLNRSLRALA